MLDRLTANLLDLCSPGQQEALEVAVATGYWHPQLATHGVVASELRPWVVPLEHQWGWLRPIWGRPLQRHLTGRAGHRRRLHLADGITGQRRPATPAAAGHGTAVRGIVEARLLGAFEFRVDGLAVTSWTGQRGTSVLRYLLSRRRHACSRDELLEEFWPDVTPAAARNRLQVAVSGLRRVLGEVTNLHVIEYADGGYRINPELRVSVDAERFEEALSRARDAERSGDPDGALVAYGEAIGLYRGDFASDAPYEQWTLLPRESLRITLRRRTRPGEPYPARHGQARRLHRDRPSDAGRRPVPRGRALPADALLRPAGADLPGGPPVRALLPGAASDTRHRPSSPDDAGLPRDQRGLRAEALSGRLTGRAAT